MLEEVSYNTIFSRIDDYTLYSYYIDSEDLEVGQTYSSPLREGDHHPSFSLFYSSYDKPRIYFKDLATGKSGNIFKFISLLFNISYIDAFYKVDEDFGFGIWNQTIKSEVVIKKSIKIKPSLLRIGITSRKFKTSDLAYWLDYGIPEETLQYYNVKALQIVHLHYEDHVSRFYPPFGFSYQIYDKYKIYQPDEEDFKFINNLDPKLIEGFQQLSYSTSTLIITKALKDVMTLYGFGFESVSPKSENTLIPYPYFKYFRKKYKQIYILFDNDGKESSDQYPNDFKKIYLPKELGKDISDVVKYKNREIALNTLKNLINE